jgi:hypothetical protein
MAGRAISGVTTDHAGLDTGLDTGLGRYDPTPFGPTGSDTTQGQVVEEGDPCYGK